MAEENFLPKIQRKALALITTGTAVFEQFRNSPRQLDTSWLVILEITTVEKYGTNWCDDLSVAASTRREAADRGEPGGHGGHAGGPAGSAGAASPGRRVSRAHERGGRGELREKGRAQGLQDYGRPQQGHRQECPLRPP